MFRDGVENGSGTSSINISSSATMGIAGRSANGLNTFNGVLDELRLTKGVARYTSGFTPPTEAFPDS